MCSKLISIFTYLCFIGITRGVTEVEERDVYVTCSTTDINPVSTSVVSCHNYMSRFETSQTQSHVLMNVTGCERLRHVKNDFLYVHKTLLIFQLKCNFSRATVDYKIFQGKQELQMVTIVQDQVKSFPPGIWNGIFRYNTSDLMLDYNNIASIENLRFPGSDNCTNVTYANISELSRASNRVTRLRRADLCALPNVKVFILKENILNSVDSDAFRDAEKLEILDLSWNKLTILADDVFSPTKLKYLNLSGNALNNDVFRSLGNASEILKVLVLSDNKITSLNFIPLLPQLERLILDGNEIEVITSDVTERFKELQFFNLQNNVIKRLNLAELPFVWDLNLGGNELGNVTFPPTLLNLELQSNHFLKLPNLAKLTSLRTLNASYNDINVIYADDFNDNVNLFALDLSYNKIERLEPNGFAKNEGLTILSLRGNRLTIVNGQFIDLRNLNSLDLAYNKITVFSYQNLSYRMKLLNLSHNHLQKIGGEYNREYLKIFLPVIDVSFNNLTSLGVNSIPDHSQNLIFNDNKIERIHPYLFSSAVELRAVDLRNNRLQSPCWSWFVVPKRSRYSISEVVHLQLQGNPLRCSCATNWMEGFFDAQKMALRSLMRPTGIEKSELGLNCTKRYLAAEDTDPETNIATSYRENHFLCPPEEKCECDPESKCVSINHENFCPDNCTCITDGYETKVIIDCSARNLTILPVHQISQNVTQLLLTGNPLNAIDDHSFSYFSKLSRLGLDSISIKRLPPEGAFRNLSKLNNLRLDNNQLTKIGKKDFVGLDRLELLNLSGNQLIAIEDGAFSSLVSLKFLDLKDNRLNQLDVAALEGVMSTTMVTIGINRNPWDCNNCEHFRKFRTWIQKYSRKIEESSNLRCLHPDSKISSMDPAYCRNDSVILNQVTTQTSLVPILSAVLSISTMVVVISVLLYKFRWEVQVLIYARYHIRLTFDSWLKPAATPVTDNNAFKVYDLFVSHSSMDELFVVNEVLPFLEPPYKVCLHERNFAGGAYITEAILEAVAVSRVTLIFLSQHFVSSEWCRFEFKIAHLQMMKDPQAKLILVLMDPHLPQLVELDTELQMFLKTNTYLCWGEKMFWKKLYFALPDQTQPQTVHE